MSRPLCPSDAPEVCGADGRRPLVRASVELAGIDYVEVYPDGVTLCVHFFGSLPKHLGARNVIVEGGVRIRDIVITDARFHEHDDGDVCLLLTVDKTGDFSTYCVCLIEPSAGAERQLPPGIDPRYACAPFSFRIDCAATLDCRPEPCPPALRPDLPPIDYLARDYESFRRLILDRLAQTMPQWRERHAPDLGITIAELLAYAADQLSYQLDAVATEAFLRTARRRVSVRRHARLVDYWMHEGCNARAWVAIDANADFPDIDLASMKFAAMSESDARGGGFIAWSALQQAAGAQIFEPIVLDSRSRIDVIAAHSQIDFYTWNRQECCLPKGSTRATLRDAPDPSRQAGDKGEKAQAAKAYAYPSQPRDERSWRLKLKKDDFLIFEETRGCETGALADADPARRHVVRLTSAVQSVDPLTRAGIWEIEWHRDDALPFDLRLTVHTGAPECANLPAAVARGNVVLVDHGVTVQETKKPSDAWVVGVREGALLCKCDGATTEQRTTPERLDITLTQSPITYAEPVADALSARALMERDPRSAEPAVRLDAAPPESLAPPRPPAAAGSSDESEQDRRPWQGTYSWQATLDLLASGRDDKHFAVEIGDEGLARLRFGDGVTGRQPEAGWQFRARYRVGNGLAGNVGRDSICWLALTDTTFSGARIRPRNPLPAVGGVAPESIDVVKRDAPYAYSRVLERAVAADDYAQLAANDVRVQGAFGELAWTGSWYEASVAIDALAPYVASDVEAAARERLEAARRINHDLRIVPVRRVPLDIALSICVRPDHLRGDVERVVRRRLSSGVAPDGSHGLFHPDEWRFGADVAGSPIVAAVQAIDGVEHVELTYFARLYDSAAAAARSKDDNVIAIAADEIAVLEGDANFPEHGRLTLRMRGGR